MMLKVYGNEINGHMHAILKAFNIQILNFSSTLYVHVASYGKQK